MGFAAKDDADFDRHCRVFVQMFLIGVAMFATFDVIAGKHDETN